MGENVKQRPAVGELDQAVIHRGSGEECRVHGSRAGEKRRSQLEVALMRKIVAAPQSNEYKKAYYKKCGKPSALELEKKEIDVAAPEVGGVEADGSERGSGSTDAKERKKEREREYCWRNRERRKEQSRVWRLMSPAHGKAYYRKNRARILERLREYKRRNHEQINAQNRQYSMRKRETLRMEEFKKRMEECKNWFKGKGDDTSKEEPVASFSCKGNGGTQYRPTNPCS